MSKRKKKSAQSAKEQKQESARDAEFPLPDDGKRPSAPLASDAKPLGRETAEPQVSAELVQMAPQKQEVPPQAAAEKPIVVSAPLKNILTRINNLKPNELAIINQVGLPIKDLADWMFMMEQTLRQVPTVTEKGIAEELYKKSMEQRQAQQTAMGLPPSTGNAGAGAGIVGQILGALNNPAIAGILGGGGSSELMNKYVDALITRNMNEMVEATTFDKIMREYFIKKMSKELGEPLMGATPKT